ncbi:unnamed protein product [Miscanthus lutarioriparius]|uniref:Uncharacterized protein n=1 Tax=Miscanthus lutarioriparius TaxID=422564 RepID=A0A811QHD7_9POAL|nr:unnamed protein product [Miscanthus lutarioriparius]
MPLPIPIPAPRTTVALSPRALPRSRHRRRVSTAEVEALAVGGSSEKASKSNASEASHQGKGVGHQAGQGRLPGRLYSSSSRSAMAAYTGGCGSHPAPCSSSSLRLGRST